MKLLELQKKVGAISKDSKNPFYNSKYFDINSLIEHLKPILNELDITIIQPLVVIDGKNALSTRVYDGDKLIAESNIMLPDNIDPQKMGSAITYFRRYSLQSLLLLQAEDDDANQTVVKSQEFSTSRKTYDSSSNGGVLDPTKECACGGSISVYKGIAKASGKPYTKLTCTSCAKTWFDNSI